MIEQHSYITVVLIIIIVIIINYFLQLNENIIAVKYEWDQHFVNLVFSTQEFYSIVQETIEQKTIPAVQIKIVSLLEQEWPSRRRLYLKVWNNKTIFLICAFPVGTDFFISYRQGIKYGANLSPDTIPTYYEHDSEKSFKESIHKCIMQAIEIMTKHYAYRDPV